MGLQVAERVREHFTDGVFFVSLAPLQSAKAIVPTIARAIGYAGDAQEQLLGYLRNKEMLLVLDNYEHLLDGSEGDRFSGAGAAR